MKQSSMRRVVRVCIILNALLVILAAQGGQGQVLMYEDFSSDVFADQSWSRNDSASISVDTLSGIMGIAQNGVEGDYASRQQVLELPFVFEFRVRTVTEGCGVATLPEVHFRDSLGGLIGSIAYSDQAGDGWLFMGGGEGWTDVHTIGAVAANQWVTVRAIIRATGGELYAKLEPDSAFTFIVMRTWAALPSEFARIGLYQMCDSHSEFDYVSVVGIARATLPYHEDFDSDLFVNGSWSRTDTTVAVDAANGLLKIGNGNVYGDGAKKSVLFDLPIAVETRMRLLNNGYNYTLPHINLIYSPTEAENLSITYLPGNPWGWSFGPWPINWTNIQQPSPSLGEWWTIRALIDSTGGQLYVRSDADTAFTLVTARSWTIPGTITQLWAVQAWDASCEFDFVSVSSAEVLRIGNPVCSTEPPYTVDFIPVYLSNQDTVKGIDLPLEYDWDVDPIAISFEGTRLAGKPTLIGQIDTATKRIRIGWASFSANDVLEPATAATADVPIAKIIMPECKRRYFSAPDTATIQLPVNPVSLELSDKYGNRYVPFFVSDSTWIRSYVPGDANGDGLCTVSDAVYLINHIFVGGPAPNCLFAADADCNVIISISDVVGIINYIFAGGPVPGMNCLCPDSPPLARIGSIGAATVMTTSDLGQNAVVVATTAEMQALQLHFTATNDVTNVKVSCSDPRLQVFSGWVDGEYRVGLIDLTGKTTLPAGTHDLLTISYEGDGELVLKSAIVVDSDAQEMATTISSAKVQSVLPTEFSLAQNRPNPFNPSTEISFSLPKPAEVTLVIYNVLGENVVTLAEGLRAAGTHAVMWDGRDKNGRAVASGVYFYRLDAGEFCATRKMMLLK